MSPQENNMVLMGQIVKRLYTLVKGMIWSKRTLADLLKLISAENKSKPPPVKLTAVQMQFDFGETFAQK